MKLSTGKVAFSIEFDDGDKDFIYFNPCDPDLMIRMNAMRGRVNDKIKDYEDVELAADGMPMDRSKIDLFEKMQNIVKGELDYAFGGEISSVVFKHCSPFAIVNGEYFFEQFINAIKPEMEKHIKAANEEAGKRMSKHLAKYNK